MTGCSLDRCELEHGVPLAPVPNHVFNAFEVVSHRNGRPSRGQARCVVNCKNIISTGDRDAMLTLYYLETGIVTEITI